MIDDTVNLPPGWYTPAWPVIERELRGRSRRVATHALRVLFGLLAGLVVWGTIAWLETSASAVEAGRGAFTAMIWVAFAACVLEGTRQTAECLSQEKREGTLGFLFLTRLRAWDVVLGKLAVSSVDALYSLLACLPALAITVVFGGVSGVQLITAMLSLLNTLFVALACGMLASTFTVRPGRAWPVALGLMGGISLIFMIGQGIGTGLIGSLVRSLSPVQGLQSATGAVSAGTAAVTSILAVAASLVVGQAIGWTLLKIAADRLKTGWRDDTLYPPPPKESIGAYWEKELIPDEEVARLESLRPLLEKDPPRWLAARQEVSRAAVFLALLIPCCADSSNVVFHDGDPAGPAWWGSLLGLILKLLALAAVAVTATRRFSVERDGDVFELLLSTPLRIRQIVGGQWRVWWRVLRLPLLLFVILPSLALTVVALGDDRGLPPAVLATIPLQGLIRAAEVIALCGVGMWLGLRMRRAAHAAGLALVVVVIAPWLAHGVAISVFSQAWSPERQLLGATVIQCIVVLGLFGWSQWRLLHDFRATVVQRRFEQRR